MDLKSLENKKILLFGKPRAFSYDEFISQLKSLSIEVVHKYSNDVSLVIDGKMMTPYEQNFSDELYEENGIKALSIDIFEIELAKCIDDDILLMSLKLSRDKNRLKSFIQNSTISDGLFFKLVRMYNWHGEDFFENDDNRDVSAAFILRFYKNIERNHNVQFATTGFSHLVAQTDSEVLLREISNLEPIKFHPRIKVTIAMNEFCSTSMQKQFYTTGGENIYQALSLNKNLDIFLIEKFFDNEELMQNIAKSIKLNDKLFELLSNFYLYLAKNQTLTPIMQNILLDKEDKDINNVLASNNQIEVDIFEKLFNLEDEDIKFTLYKNSVTPKELLVNAYKDERYHSSLAINENTPIDILYQLQLDRRYERDVKTNPAFGKHIQSENIGWL